MAPIVLGPIKPSTSSLGEGPPFAGETPFSIGEVTKPGGARSDAKGRGETWAVSYEGALRYAK